jgi:hypothetical protein
MDTHQMITPGGGLEQRIRISGVLLVMGLIIEAVSLAWANPTAFIVFVVVGGTSMAAGMLLFLYSVASQQKASST